MREQSGIHGPKLNNNQTRTEKIEKSGPGPSTFLKDRTILDRNKIFQELSDQFRDSQTRPGRTKLETSDWFGPAPFRY